MESESAHDPMRGTHNASMPASPIPVAITSVLTDSRGRFMVGAVRLLVLVPRPRGDGVLAVGQLMDNLHWSPGAFAGDLLSPLVRAWVAHEPALVESALASTCDDFDDHATELVSRSFGVAPYFRGLGTVPPGSAALAAGLGRDPAGLSAGAWAGARRALKDGDPWAAVAPVRLEVDTLAETVHVACQGPNAKLNLMALAGGEAFRSRAPGAAFPYHVPTGSWWGLLGETCADTVVRQAAAIRAVARG